MVMICDYVRDIISSDSAIVLTLSSPIVSQKEYWSKVAEEDEGQETTNPNILASRIIKRGGPITHEDVNSVISSQGYSITEEELEALKNVEFMLYSLSGMVINFLKSLYPSTRKKPLIVKQ